LEDGVGMLERLRAVAMVYYPPKDRQKGEKYNFSNQGRLYQLVLSVRLENFRGGNSGYFWGVKEVQRPARKPTHFCAKKFRLLDNEKHPDAKKWNYPIRPVLYMT